MWAPRDTRATRETGCDGTRRDDGVVSATGPASAPRLPSSAFGAASAASMSPAATNAGRDLRDGRGEGGGSGGPVEGPGPDGQRSSARPVLEQGTMQRAEALPLRRLPVHTRALSSHCLVDSQVPARGLPVIAPAARLVTDEAGQKTSTPTAEEGSPLPKRGRGPG